nr:MAG TPA: hypothetical protein [Bacteriophage sp.]
MADDTQSSPIDMLFQEFNQATLETDKIREQIIQQLVNTIPTVDYKNDSARDIEVKMGVIKTLDDILKSKESSKANKITTYLKRKDTENTENYQEAVLAVLNNLDPEQFRKGNVTIQDNVDDQLEQQFETSGQSPIKPGETEIDAPVPNGEK